MKSTLAIPFLLISVFANAGLLDSLKDPATLILNQKDCRFGKSTGEIVDGKYIVAGSRVLVVLKKLDGNRVTFENQTLEPKTTVVLNIKLKDGWVEGGVGDGQPFIGCKLN